MSDIHVALFLHSLKLDLEGLVLALPHPLFQDLLALDRFFEVCFQLSDSLQLLAFELLVFLDVVFQACDLLVGHLELRQVLQLILHKLLLPKERILQHSDTLDCLLLPGTFLIQVLQRVELVIGLGLWAHEGGSLGFCGFGPVAGALVRRVRTVFFQRLHS